LAGQNSLYGWSVYADLKDSKTNAIYLSEPQLGLGRDYYQKINDKNTATIGKYIEYMADMLYYLEVPNPLRAARDVAYLETGIAQHLLTNEEIRDITKQYNPKTMIELKTLSKNINWVDYLTKSGVHTDKVIIGEIKFFEDVDKFLNEKNLPTIKNYLKFHLISGNAGYLSKTIDDRRFNFYGKYLNGQQEQRAMNKRAYEVINRNIGEAFGKLYVEKYFPAESKAKMVELIDYLKKSFAIHISNLSWMSDVTKQKALEKLNKFTVKVAYPDKWKDYSALSIQSEKQGGSLYKNMQNISLWRYNEDLNKIGKPVDKMEWGMTPQTVNAYYNPLNNEIVFPAAILQSPFFNANADAVV
ncbi:MAG TPA: M13 family metallopeptidase, partial [Saprospiraceae bacterium]|nr:M13 family metallopeptidase [Saprospiraceae bacterium]